MSEHFPFENTPLPYSYNALEPYIDEQTMHLHHDKHLQTYIDQLNAALRDQTALHTMSLTQLIVISPKLPSHVGVPIGRNAGGVLNHRFYFSGLQGEGSQQPEKALVSAIERSFGSFDIFRKAFSAAAQGVFGSGYAFLVCDHHGTLSIMTTANQDTPLNSRKFPILNLDVWEHAYYLKHHNKRGDYIDDWWNVVNWAVASEQYMHCMNRQCFPC